MDTTQNERPLFSIIIATYNRSHLLKRALKSLIAQTEKDWEAIIVDDESTDDTYEQVLPYLFSYSKIRYIGKNHSGEVKSKNQGIFAARGKYISFLDSDDEYAPNHLESRKTILLQNPHIKFLYGGTHILGNQYVPDRFNRQKQISLKDCVIGGTFFIERQTLFDLNGLLDIYLGSDADLFDRANESKISIMKTQLPTYIYHHEIEDSITNNLYMSI